MEIQEEFNTLNILTEMQRNLGVIKRIKSFKKESVELKIGNWATPLGLLPLAIYSNNLNIRITSGRNSSKIKSYLEKIKFPEGTTKLGKMSGSSYLPLSKLNVDSDDATLTLYEDLLLAGVKNDEIRNSFRNSLKYLISELVTNIKEHAHIDHYWILAQYWPATKTCQIAIADTGIGYLESYRNTHYEVTSHKEAITNTVKGNSSKDDVERGAGIPGMIKIFCEGYKGDLALMSGDALLFLSGGKMDFYELDNLWQGVFVGLQFKLSIINTLAFLVGS